jgi:hypothetical protein
MHPYASIAAPSRSPLIGFGIIAAMTLVALATILPGLT